MAAALAACVPEPKKAYSPDEIQTLESLEELMRVNAQKADPLFAKRDQQAYTDAEFADMAEAAAALRASAERTGARFGGQAPFDDGFVAYAKELATHAQSLSDASGAKDAAAAGKALESMRNTCKACHGVYR